MADTLQKGIQRKRRRLEGMRQLEVWLPQDAVRKLDIMKDSMGADSRNEVLLRLLSNTLVAEATAHSTDQLELNM